MLERLIKWFGSAEIGSIGKIFLLGSLILAIGVGLSSGIAAGWTTFGACVLAYALGRTFCE